MYLNMCSFISNDDLLNLVKLLHLLSKTKDILTMLLDEVEGTNQLVESCKIYLTSKLFITELVRGIF